MGSSMDFQMTGFVGSDPQVREVGDQRVASFSVAASRKNRSGQKQTQWVRVNCWNKLADVAEQYVHKGSLVQVKAEWLRKSAWIDKNGTLQAGNDIDAHRLVLLDRVGSNEYGDDEGQLDDIPF